MLLDLLSCQFSHVPESLAVSPLESTRKQAAPPLSVVTILIYLNFNCLAEFIWISIVVHVRCRMSASMTSVTPSSCLLSLPD